MTRRWYRPTLHLALLTAVLVLATATLDAAIAAAQKANSNTRLYRVKRDDTLALIAAEHYGDRKYQILIMAANSLQHARDLKPGMRLRIPVSRPITTRPGDTLASLAEQHLGDPRRAQFLARFNQLDPDGSLPAGLDLVIPLQIQHTARGRETLAQIAASYFGSRSKLKKAKDIRQYNFLTSNALAAGDSITIPVESVQVSPNRQLKADADSAARRTRRSEMQKRARRWLPRAREAWYNGEYERVKGLLAEIEIDYLDTEDAVAVGVLLGRTYVAFDDETTALAVFRKVQERAPEHALRSHEYSPKVRAVWQKAQAPLERDDGSDGESDGADETDGDAPADSGESDN